MFMIEPLEAFFFVFCFFHFISADGDPRSVCYQTAVRLLSAYV
jgi:hypothetical protein